MTFPSTPFYHQLVPSPDKQVVQVFFSIHTHLILFSFLLSLSFLQRKYAKTCFLSLFVDGSAHSERYSTEYVSTSGRLVKQTEENEVNFCPETVHWCGQTGKFIARSKSFQEEIVRRTYASIVRTRELAGKAKLGWRRNTDMNDGTLIVNC